MHIGRCDNQAKLFLSDARFFLSFPTLFLLPVLLVTIIMIIILYLWCYCLKDLMRHIFKKKKKAVTDLKSECSNPERKLNTGWGCTRMVRNARWLIISPLAMLDWLLNQVVQIGRNQKGVAIQIENMPMGFKRPTVYDSYRNSLPWMSEPRCTNSSDELRE